MKDHRVNMWVSLAGGGSLYCGQMDHERAERERDKFISGAWRNSAGGDIVTFSDSSGGSTSFISNQVIGVYIEPAVGESVAQLQKKFMEKAIDQLEDGETWKGGND